MSSRNSSPPKGENRIVIEEALKAGTRAHPLDAAAIAQITGLSISLVRTHVNNCVNADLAYNVNEAGKVGAAYAWGMRPESHKHGDLAAPRTVIPTGCYTGEKPAAIRPGSMDAYSLPSRSGGESIERKRPILIGARAEQRV